MTAEEFKKAIDKSAKVYLDVVQADEPLVVNILGLVACGEALTAVGIESASGDEAAVTTFKTIQEAFSAFTTHLAIAGRAVEKGA